MLQSKNSLTTNLNAQYRTAYDVFTAQVCDAAGVDLVLVGDSLGMTIQVSVTLEDMIYHTEIVTRSLKHPFVIGDMPFGTYTTPNQAVETAVRLAKKTLCNAVKLEGGVTKYDQIKSITDNGINVMGHIGLTPQTADSLGGFVVCGKTASSAHKLIDDALSVQKAGAFGIVLECVPNELANYITQILDIPTIGIGAGPYCSGQVQVIQDTLGMFHVFKPKFARRYMQAFEESETSLTKWISDVKESQFPHYQTESFQMKTAIYQKFLEQRKHLYQDQRFDEFNLDLSGMEKTANTESEEQENLSLYFSSEEAVAKPEIYYRDSSTKMKTGKNILVIGGGAMGSLFASKLSGIEDVNVEILSNFTQQLAAVNQNGIETYNLVGDKIVDVTTTSAGSIQAYSEFRKEDEVQFDIIFAFTKGTTSTKHAGEVIQSKLSESGIAVTLHNGLGYGDILNGYLSESQTLVSGLTYVGSTLKEPGRLIYMEGKTCLESSSDGNLKMLGSLLEKCNIGEIVLFSEEEKDMFQELVWKKLVVNACVNPLGSLLGVENGKVGANTSAAALMRGIIEEILLISGKLNIWIHNNHQELASGNFSDLELKERIISEIVSDVQQVCKNSSKNTNSMLADIQKKRDTEIDSIVGVILAYGREFNIKTPINQTMYNLVNAKSISSRALE